MLPLLCSRYRFVFRAASAVVLGVFPAGVVRGALGGALRAVACTTGAAGCEGCPITASCAYGRLFVPSAAPPTLHGGFAEPPHPYVVHLERPLPPEILPGERFEVDLVLVESAVTTLPALVRAARRLEQTGLGDARDRGCGRLVLQRVEARHARPAAVVWTASRPHLLPLPAPAPLGATPPPADAQQPLRLRFVSPLRLRSGGALLAAPTPAELVRALVRRVSALAALHGRLDAAFAERLRAWSDEASALGVVEARFHPAVRTRYSARQGRRVPLEGVLGTLTLAPGWLPLWPLLDAGRLLHLGKNATHGLGQYRLEVAPLPDVIPARSYA